MKNNVLLFKICTQVKWFTINTTVKNNKLYIIIIYPLFIKANINIYHINY